MAPTFLGDRLRPRKDERPSGRLGADRRGPILLQARLGPGQRAGRLARTDGAAQSLGVGCAVGVGLGAGRGLRLLGLGTFPRPEPDFNLSLDVARAEVRAVRVARHVSHALWRFEQRCRLLAERDLSDFRGFVLARDGLIRVIEPRLPDCAGSASSRRRSRGRRRTRRGEWGAPRRTSTPTYLQPDAAVPSPTSLGSRSISQSGPSPTLRTVWMNTRGSSPMAS